MRLLKILAVLFVAVCVILFCILLYIGNQAKSVTRQAYGQEAIQALTLDAALSFPTVLSERVSIHRRAEWAEPETPCIFTTNEVKRSGNTSRVTWRDWLSGKEPSCDDFYSSAVNVPSNRSTTIPSTCQPPFTMRNRGGDAMSFIAVAADGADTTSLSEGQLSAAAMKRLKGIRASYSGFRYTPNFVRGNGLASVLIQKQGVERCEGFDLFRFKTKVKNIQAMRPDLEAAGYYVGLK